jgi:hypothetical protein
MQDLDVHIEKDTQSLMYHEASRNLSSPQFISSVVQSIVIFSPGSITCTVLVLPVVRVTTFLVADYHDGGD